MTTSGSTRILLKRSTSDVPRSLTSKAVCSPRPRYHCTWNCGWTLCVCVCVCVRLFSTNTFFLSGGCVQSASCECEVSHVSVRISTWPSVACQRLYSSRRCCMFSILVCAQFSTCWRRIDFFTCLCFYQHCSVVIFCQSEYVCLYCMKCSHMCFSPTVVLRRHSFARPFPSGVSCTVATVPFQITFYR